MDERNIVELSLRLPAGELGRLARLMEQVRGLLALEGSGAAGPAPAGRETNALETGVNTAFDAVRFQQMGEAGSAAAGENIGAEEEAEKAEEGSERDAPEIPAVSAEAETQAAEADSAGFPVGEMPEAVPAETAVLEGPEIPAAKAEMSPGPEAPAGSAEAARQAEIETAPSVRSEERAELPVPMPAVPDVQQSLREAQSAGIAVQTELAENRGGVFAAVEELVSAGPAPLTAEAVALAFQRDDRRYDNGFPLY